MRKRFLLALAFTFVAAEAGAQTASWTSATTVDTALSVGISNYGDVALTYAPSGSITAGQLNFEVSDDGANWYATQCMRQGGPVAESLFALNSATAKSWVCQTSGIGQFRVRLNPAITGTGTANLRATLTSAISGPQLVVGTVSIGTSGKTNVLKTGALTTTATTADQVVLTYTVTTGSTLFLSYLTMECEFTTPSATATVLGVVSLETPSGTKGISTTCENATVSVMDRIVIPFTEPISVASGTVVRVVTTPATATSIKWQANFGGYEK